MCSFYFLFLIDLCIFLILYEGFERYEVVCVDEEVYAVFNYVLMPISNFCILVGVMKVFLL